MLPRRWSALLLMALVASMAFVATAQEDTEEALIEDEEMEFEDVQVSERTTARIAVKHIFPDAVFGNIESGKFAEVLIGFENMDDTEYLISTLEGSFRYPQDFEQVLQNFSTYKYDVLVKPGEQASLSYRWYIPPVFEPREFGLTVLITFVDSEEHVFRVAGYNGTITVVDPLVTVDVQGFFLYVMVAAFLGAVGYFVYTTYIDKPAKRAKRTTQAAPVEQGTTTAVRSEWIDEHNLRFKKQSSPRVGAQ